MSKKRTYTVYQEYWSDEEQSYEEQEIDVTVIYSRQPDNRLTFQIVKMKPRVEVDEDIDRQIIEAIEGEEAAIADYQAEREWSHQQEEK